MKKKKQLKLVFYQKYGRHLYLLLVFTALFPLFIKVLWTFFLLRGMLTFIFISPIFRLV